MNEYLVKNISQIIDYLDKIIEHLKADNGITREQDIAVQKLEEAVFWLTYGIGDDNVEDQK